MSSGTSVEDPPSYSPFHTTDRPENPSTDTSHNTGPPQNIKAAAHVSITNPNTPLTGTFVIDPHKTAPRFPNYPKSQTQQKKHTNPLSQDKPNLQLVSTDEPIDVNVWLVESPRVKTSRTKTRIVMTQTKEEPITAQINRLSPTPSSMPSHSSHPISRSSRPTPFVANVHSHGLVHLSIPRNYLGPLTIVAENRAVLSMDVRSVVTDWDESVETSTNEQEGKKVATISCFLGDWEEANEASDREGEGGGEDSGDNGWKYDELEVAGHSVIVQYVDEDNEIIRGFEFGVSLWAQTNGSTSAPTSNSPPSPLRSFLSAGIYRIRSSVKPELYVEMQDDGFVRPVPLNESSDGQKWKIIPREGGDDYNISNIKDNKVLSIKTSTSKLGNSIPSGEHSNQHSRWLIEPRLKTCIIGIPDDERVLDLSGGKNLIFYPLNGRRQQRWFIEPIILNASTSVADGSYVIHNRGQDCYWNAGHSPIQTLLCYSTPLSNARSQSYTTWRVTHDASGDLLFQSPYAPTSWPAAGLNGSQTPVPWRCIPESPGSQWHYLTTDMTNSINPQVATPPPKTVNERGSFTELKQGDWNQMWEFVSI